MFHASCSMFFFLLKRNRTKLETHTHTHTTQNKRAKRESKKTADQKVEETERNTFFAFPLTAIIWPDTPVVSGIEEGIQYAGNIGSDSTASDADAHTHNTRTHVRVQVCCQQSMVWKGEGERKGNQIIAPSTLIAMWG